MSKPPTTAELYGPTLRVWKMLDNLYGRNAIKVDMSAKGIAHNAARGILKDLKNRRGLRQEWEQIDEEIRQEIIESWEQIIEAEINASELEDSEHE